MALSLVKIKERINEEVTKKMPDIKTFEEMEEFISEVMGYYYQAVKEKSKKSKSMRLI